MRYPTLHAARCTKVLALAALLTSLPPLSLGCGGAESAMLVNDARANASDIDRDPLALLPPDPLAVGHIDATALFRSSLGPEAIRLFNELLPLGSESNFVVQRDVTHIYGGAYALMGADFCAVVQGTFDEAAIQKAAELGAKTLVGAPLVSTSYAGYTMYSSGGFAFVLLTPRTILAGDDAGIRRALDRLRTGRVSRSVPPWMTAVVESRETPLALTADLTGKLSGGTPLIAFLGDVQHVRMLGNFDSPGMNVSAAVSFPDPAKAQNAVNSFQKLEGMMRAASLMGALGFTVPPIESTARDSDANFLSAIDQPTAKKLMQTAVTFGKALISVRAAPVTTK